MRFLRIVLIAFTLGLGFSAFSNSTAQAAVKSVATANVNLRAGPSTKYPVVVVVPVGAPVRTFGCVSGYRWCDVAFGNYRGWISSSYLRTIYKGAPVVLTPVIAPAVGIGVVAYNRAYWNRHYAAYPWYGRWAAYPAGRVAVRGGTYTGPAGNTFKTGAACGVRGCARGVVGPNGGAAVRVRRW